ncbi:MAG: RNA polymerase sigma factor [Phycisphaerae bacterium]
MTNRSDSSFFKTVTSTSMLEGLKDPGNKTIWQDFVERYRPMVERYACRMGLGLADAQDAAQQTLIAFCSAYQQGKYEREKGRLRVWLFGIARNQIRNLARKRARQEVQAAQHQSQTDFFARLSDDNQLEQAWEAEWRDALLRQCLEEVRQEFDAKTLDAFELFAWKGMPAQEVGQHLDMTPNAVFICKHRVMKRIRELLPKMEEIW